MKKKSGFKIFPFAVILICCGYYPWVLFQGLGVTRPGFYALVLLVLISPLVLVSRKLYLDRKKIIFLGLIILFPLFWFVIYQEKFYYNQLKHALIAAVLILLISKQDIGALLKMLMNLNTIQSIILFIGI